MPTGTSAMEGFEETPRDWRGSPIVPGHPEYVAPPEPVNEEEPAPIAPTLEERVVALEATVISLRDRVRELVDGNE